MRILVVLASVILLAGCMSATVMRNPVTGQTALCQPGAANGVFDRIACERAYEEAGWVKVEG